MIYHIAVMSLTCIDHVAIAVHDSDGVDEAPRPGAPWSTVDLMQPQGSVGTLIELVQA